MWMRLRFGLKEKIIGFMCILQVFQPEVSSSKAWQGEIVGLDTIPWYGGVIIHDCWTPYLSYDHCGHGLCGSHLLWELVFIIDS